VSFDFSTCSIAVLNSLATTVAPGNMRSSGKVALPKPQPTSSTARTLPAVSAPPPVLSIASRSRPS